MNHLNSLLLIMLTLLLTACDGSEPSESDISDAINKQFKAQLEQSAGIFDEKDITIRYIKKIGCNKAEDKGGYLCDVDVDIDVKLPFVGTQNQKGVQSLRFVKTDNGWSVVQ